MFFEKTLSQKLVYDGKILRLRVDEVELDNGKITKREVVEHSGAVAIVAIDSEDQVLLVRQYRYGVATELLELPAGKIDAGEQPEVCGHRELKEETGYESETLQYLTKTFPSPAAYSEVIYIYYSDKLKESTQKLDEDEILAVERIPFSKAVEMVMTGEITDSKTQIGLLMVWNQRKGK